MLSMALEDLWAEQWRPQSHKKAKTAVFVTPSINLVPTDLLLLDGGAGGVCLLRRHGVLGRPQGRPRAARGGGRRRRRHSRAKLRSCTRRRGTSIRPPPNFQRSKLLKCRGCHFPSFRIFFWNLAVWFLKVFLSILVYIFSFYTRKYSKNIMHLRNCW